EAAREHLGVVCGPSAAIARTDLVEITTSAGTVEPRDLYAVFPSRRLLPKRVRLAIDWIAAAQNRGDAE
ncbi:MAG TPA: hypothetical protein VNO21_25215, partial [Polyangiaceae bacterium]|nr:hypothetical protein [Polyangiaceae bacterium]